MINKKNGFSIIEVLITIAIFALISSVSFFLLKDYSPNIQISGATRDIVSDLRLTQQLAVSYQEYYCFEMFFQEKRYQVKKCNDSQIVIEKNLSDKITSFSAQGFTENKVEFNFYGAVREAGIITLTNNLDKSKQVEVKLSGFVKVIN